MIVTSWLLRTLALALLFFWAPALPGQAEASSPDPKRIMEIVSAKETHESSSLEIEMILIDQAGGQRVRSMKTFSQNGRQTSKRVVFFLEPKDIKGTAFLTLERKDQSAQPEQWIYLPAMKKAKRIALGETTQSFMGSDLNHADLSRRRVDDFNYKILREDQVNNQKVWLLEALPKTPAVAQRVGYNRALLIVRKDNHMIIRAVNWMLSGNRLRYFEVKKLEKIDGIWAPREVQIWTVAGKKTLHKTVLRSHKLRFNQKLPDDLFSLLRIERGL